MAQNREEVHAAHFTCDLSRPDEYSDLRNEIESILEAKVTVLRQLNEEGSLVRILAVGNIIEGRDDVRTSA